MKNTTLVIMAAGIGSRFGGGIKQLEPVGPNGEIIMDYSIHDALEAGFNKIVFIIRKDLEKDFKEIIGSRIEKIAEVAYAYQELNHLPDGYEKPEDRTKPWGTGQAVLSIKGLVNEPFLVINADDYYGKEGFNKIHEYMVNEMNEDADVYDLCMGGFILSNTLSENGGVTRGLAKIDGDGILEHVTETYDIFMEDGDVSSKDETGRITYLDETSYVSMNMWGIPPKFLDELEKGFPEFLDSLEEGDIKSEYLLPKIVDQMITSNKIRVTMLKTRDKWFGVTYREDKELVVDAIRSLIKNGVYQEKLF